MIYSYTLNSLTEDELSILFYICDLYLKPIGIDAKYDFLKMLKKNTVIPIIENLKQQAQEESKNIFDTLKEKLLQET
jgi:hypothetical protein